MNHRSAWNAYILACGSLLLAAGVATAKHPAQRILVFNTISNVASGRSLWVAGDRSDIGNMTSTGGVRLYSAGANQWVGSVAVRATTGSVLSFSFVSRDNASGQNCTVGNAYWGPTLTTNLTPWNPGYTGKTIYYHTSWTNASILYRLGLSETFVDAPMTRLGAGRTSGEYLYRVTGIAVAGEPIEFVAHGHTTAGVEQWDNAPYGGYGANNYYTPLDDLFLQDGNIFNYWPPATVSAPSIGSVSFTSSYTGNGIPSRSGKVYLPRGYTQNSSKRYPVLYMHDGQNVFDPGGAFGSWSADYTATKEIGQGRMRETIIVAVDNTASRMSEYGTPQDGYTGNYYLLFLINNVKTQIDSNYRTLSDMMNTGNMGSSLGGIIAAYIGLSTNKFGLIGAVSPSYWYGPNFRSWINTANTKGKRIYQDCGTSEGSCMWDYFWPVYGYYLADGYVYNDDIQVAIGCGQEHNEAAWANRLHNGFQFLYDLWDETNSLATNVVSAGTVQFKAATYSVAENGGSARLYVSRIGGSSGAASVNYATANGTATAGADYTATNGVLNWANGDAADKYLDVVILDDLTYEGNEAFTANLSGAGGAGLGSPALTTVAILENDPPPPSLVITNPPTDITVAHDTTTYTLQGTANTTQWVGLTWTNGLTGAAGLSPISPSWTISGVGLGVGTNEITVSATNVGSAVVAADSATNTTYDGGWGNGSNGGAGWGAWSLTNWGSANAGFFIATVSEPSLSIGPRAWALWANSGATAEATRSLPHALALSEVLSLQFDNNEISNGFSVGIGLQNESKVNLFEFMFIGGATNYVINDSVMTRNTLIPWSSNGWALTFQLTASNQYRFTAGAHEITGTLTNIADLGITRFKVWNYSAGPGWERNLYINDMVIMGAGGAVTTNAKVSIIRLPSALFVDTDGDGMDDNWEAAHGLLVGINDAGLDPDNDGILNGDEYILDTNPKVFNAPPRIHLSGLGSVFNLKAGPSTTNSRRYELMWKSELPLGTWTSAGQASSGHDDGSMMEWTLTNSTDAFMYYRARITLPGP